MHTFLQALLRRAVQKLQNWKKKLSALLNFFTRFTLFLQKDCAKIWHYYKNGGGKSVKLNHSCNFPSYTRHFFVLPWLWTSARFIRMVGTFSKPHVPFHRLGLWFRSMTLKTPRSMLVVFRLFCHFWISIYELEFLPSVAKLMIDLFSSIAQYKMPFFSRSYKMRWNRYLLTIPVLLINGTHSLIVLAHCQKFFFLVLNWIIFSAIAN